MNLCIVRTAFLVVGVTVLAPFTAHAQGAYCELFYCTAYGVWNSGQITDTWSTGRYRGLGPQCRRVRAGSRWRAVFLRGLQRRSVRRRDRLRNLQHGNERRLVHRRLPLFQY